MDEKHAIMTYCEQLNHSVEELNDSVANNVLLELNILVNNLKYLHRLFQCRWSDEWYVRRVAYDCYMLLTNDYKKNTRRQKLSRGMRYVNDDIIKAIQRILSDQRSIHTASFLEIEESGKTPELIQYIREVMQSLSKIQ